MGSERDAAWYDESYSRWEWRDKPAEGTPWTPLWKAVLAHIRPEDQVLDLGCGAGQLAELRQARDGRSTGYWTGMDFSRTALEAALRRVPVATWCDGDVREVPPSWFQGADVVVISETLEHIEDDLAVLRQIPAGKRVVLSVPNFDSDGHVRWFTSPRLAEERYKPFLTNDYAARIVLAGNPERWWYVLSGVRA
jgi:trans-aconitate methyltransferase